MARFQSPEAVFCSETAVMLLGLPVYRVRDQRPQVILPVERKIKHSRAIRRRTAVLTADEIVATHGLRHTGMERTVLDAARFMEGDVALGIAEAALGKLFPESRRDPDSEEVGLWRARMFARLDEMTGERGVQRARNVLERAAATADSVYESIGKLRFLQLGYRVRAQVPVRRPGTGCYYVDLEIEGLDLFVEIDGRVKYTDLDLRGDETLDEILYRERQRENWISGVTGKRMIRLRPADLVSVEALARRLRVFGVPLPPVH